MIAAAATRANGLSSAGITHHGAQGPHQDDGPQVQVAACREYGTRDDGCLAGEDGHDAVTRHHEEDGEVAVLGGPVADRREEAGGGGEHDAARGEAHGRMIARCGPTGLSLGRRRLGYRSGVRTARTITTAVIALLAATVTAAGQGMYDPAPDPAPAPVPTPQPTKPTRPTAPWSPVAPPNARVSWAGRLLVVATARANPGPGGKPLRLLQPIAPLGAGPVGPQVRGVKVVAGKRWVQVLMSVRPNGSPGWARASDGSGYTKGVVSHHPCNQLQPDNRTCIGSGYNGLVQFDGTHVSNILAWR